MRPFIKGIILLIVLLSAVAVIHLDPVQNALADVYTLSAGIKAFGWWSPLVYIAAVILLISVGVPRLLLCPVGGMAFGFFWGLIWSQVGTMIGYYLTFLFVRWSGREYVLKKWPKLDQYKDFFRAKGFLVVLLIRQMPIAGFYINIVLGLSHIRHTNFLLGTVLGILPEAIPATMIGAGVIALSPEKSIVAISIAAVFFVIVWTIIGRYFRLNKLKFAAAVNDTVLMGKDEISV
jgi:uncharacterized membrane protein YdjX (TVP38/TMEM64 family)